MRRTTLYSFLIIIGLSFVVSGCITGSGDKMSQPGAGTNTDLMEDSLDIKGSDTLLQLVSSMAEAFMEANEKAEVSVTGGGSGTGIAGLLNDEIPLANASRNIKQKETDKAGEMGKEFKSFIVARDGLSIVVHRDNPVTKLTVDQVGKIFKGEITNWNEVGGDDQSINLYGRQSTSGTYEFMQKEVLKGDYADTMRNLEGNQAIVDAVKEDVTGIGYAGIAYAVNAGDAVTILDIAEEEGGEFYTPTEVENIESGVYPITRPLYQFILDLPEKGGIIHEFLKFENSGEGQEIIEEVGYYNPNTEDQKANSDLFEMIGQ